MAGWSFRIGRVFGVEVRLHSFFVFLLFPAAVWAASESRLAARGFMLWGLLLAAVAVREVARAVAAMWFSLEIKSVLLLPTGGLTTYASAEVEARAAEGKVQRWLALVGPGANFLFGLMMMGLVVTVAPTVNLVAMPWVSPAHLVRTLVWVNMMLGALNLLPAWPLDGGRVARGETLRGSSARPARMLPRRLQGLVRMSWAIAVGLIVYGMVAPNWWVLMAGLAVLLGAQVERQGLLPERETDGTRVGDVMLTAYDILPASATLEDAMMQARHSLQDDFPVVRAGNVVGAVGRQSILDALATSGNGYVQGIMTRSFVSASANDSLMETLNRAIGRGGSTSLQMVPVVDGEVVVGILTPQHLKRSMGLLPRPELRSGRPGTEDETE